MLYTQYIKRITSISWLPNLLGIFGVVAYLVQSWYFAHTQISVIDEGAYLLKGYMFATGKYVPFQDYGPWTNHMPLSFFIPGWVQLIFGPGLRTGRYLAIGIGMIMLLGVWVLSNRFGNRWWRALLIWLIALNAPVLRVYSTMTSQILVSCIVVWILVLVLGPDRKKWQIYLGVILAGILFFTRINMAPVLTLLIFYIFWEHGKRVGSWATVAGILVVGLGHAIFWPGILKLWAYWSPINFLFLENWKLNTDAVRLWDPDIDFRARFLSFLLALQIHFTVIVGFLISTIMWSPKRTWRTEWRYRVAIFLGVSFILLFAIHALATLGLNYCVYCLPNYVMFFQYIGLFFIFVTITSWDRLTVHFNNTLLIILMSLVFIGVSNSPGLGKPLTDTWIGDRIRNLVNLVWQIEVPRIREMNILPGKTPLWILFENKFGWSENQILDVSVFLVVLVFGWIFLYLITRLIEGNLRVFTKLHFSLNAVLMIVFLAVGSLLTLRIGYLRTNTDCSWEVISTYEAAGSVLADTIDPGSRVYWRGASTVPLLYLADYSIYPPQLNDVYTYYLGGDPDELLRFSMWNRDLDYLWQEDADYILIEGTRGVPDVEYSNELTPTPPLLPCNPKTQIHIYMQK